MKKKSLPVFFVGLLMCGCQMKEVINEYNVVPLPVTMSEQQGRFYLNSDVPIVVNPYRSRFSFFYVHYGNIHLYFFAEI